MNRCLIAFVAAIAVIAAGCRSSRPAAGSDNAVQPLTLTERAAAVASGNKPWTELNVPVKVALRSPMKLSVSGRVYMRRDKDIYMSLRVFGMEVANMYVNADSVYVADKYHKYYIAEPIGSVFAGASLTIGDIQDALLGRVFVNGMGTFNDTMMKQVTLSLAGDGAWSITPRSKIGPAAYSFMLSDADNALTGLNFDTGKKTYGCTYARPATVDGGRFMSQLDIKAKMESKEIDATLAYDFGKVKWEVPASAHWRAPGSNYRRLDPRSVAKALSE